MARVIHTGDTHLGYRQYHSEKRREDFFAAFQSVVDDAVAEDVDAVVHAGDLFHTRRPNLQDLVGTIDLLSELDAAAIPFLAVVGNHEGTRHAQWLDLFESLGLATRLGEEPVRVEDMAVYGQDYVPEAQRDTLTYSFEPNDAPFAVLVSHGAFEPFPYGTWSLEELLTEAPVSFDAVLLGDNHDSLRDTVDGTPVAYAGSTERVSADERDDRGYNLVQTSDGIQISRRGLPTRKFVFIDVELSSGEGHDRIRQRIDEEAIEDAVVIITVEGDGDRVVPADVEAYADEQGALVARVNDRRELDDEVDIDVEFADPDAAVQERVRELGLSPAAQSIDDTVRSSEVPDSNVGTTIEERVRDLVDDPANFQRSDDSDAGREDARAVDDAPEKESAERDDDEQVTMEDYL